MKYIPILVLLLILSCKQKVNTTIPTIYVPISNSSNNSLQSDSIFESVEYIHLEETEESHLTRIKKILPDGNNLLVWDDFINIIVCFKNDGSFVRTLFLRDTINDFAIDENRLYILPKNNPIIYIHDQETFERTDSIKLDAPYISLASAKKEIYLYSGNRGAYDITVIDKKSHKIVTQYRELSEDQRGAVPFQKTFANQGEKVYASFPLDNRLFEISPKGYYPVSIISFPGGEYESAYGTKPYEEVKKIYEERYKPTNRNLRLLNNIENLYLTDKFILFTLYRETMDFILYNRKTGLCQYGRIYESDKFPIFISNLFSLTPDNELITYEYAKGIENYMKRDSTIQIPASIKGLKNGDNGVVIKYKLK